MARAALSIVGGAVGFFVGGFAGAAVGMQLGGAVGGLIEGPQQFEGPRLTDLRVTSSTYGMPIPLVYGPANRVTGNMIWTSGLIEKKTKKKSGGKGGGGSETTEYSYSAHVAIAIGEGAKDFGGKGYGKLKRIWCNGKLLVDVEQMFLRAISNANSRVAEATSEIAYWQQQINGWTAGQRPSLEYLESQLAKWQGALASAQQALIDAQQAYDDYLNEVDGGWSMFNVIGSSVGINKISYYPGDFVQIPDPTIEAALGAGNAPAYRGTCYVVIEGLQLADYGNSIPNIEFEIGGIATGSVAGVVDDISRRCGLEAGEYAVGGQLCQDEIEGYAIGRQSQALSAIAPLRAAYGFDVTEQGGQVRYVKRGRMAIASIEQSDMAARERGDGTPPETPMTTERMPDVELPKLATITYKDPERDYQDNTQRAIRDKGSVQHKIDEQLPLTLDNRKARQVVDRMLWESWVGRMLAKFKVSDKLAFLRPGDVVAVRVAGIMTPFRIEQFTRGHDGVIECSARMEDPFIYIGSTAGIAATIPANEVQFVGDTLFYAYNAPIIYPGESDTAFSWAMDAEESGWRGGQAFRSLDNIDFTFQASSKFRNTTGVVAGVLPAAGAEYWDRVNKIAVTLTHPEHELESFHEESVLNGINAFWLGAPDGSAGEVMQFATATLISSNPKVYELSNLLRGRRGSEHYIDQHVANEVFVYFEQGLMSTADFGQPDWDLSRWYKGVSIYQVEADVTDVQEFINTGEKARIPSPILAEGERDVSNNLSFTWVRRARGLTPTFGETPVPLMEESEQYEIDIYNGASVVRTISTTTAAATYTAAEQTADGLTPGNPVTMSIYQISATRGRGHAGEFIL